MKFNSIGILFQHIRTTHIDRVTSPSAYIEHITRLTGSYSSIAPPYRSGDEIYNRKDDNRAQLIKLNHDSPRSEYCPIPSGSDCTRNTPSQDDENRSREIKLEEQNSPTDLSQKRSTPKQTPSHSPCENRENDSIDQLKLINNNNAGLFVCNQCNAALPNFETFRNHLKYHLKSQTNPTQIDLNPFMCTYCGITLANQIDFDRHNINHFLIKITEFACAFNCNKNFDKSDDLQKHLFDQHAQNLWKCTICNELFDTKVSIQVHLTVAHTNEMKLYRCSACMEQFKNEQEFENHVRQQHVSSSTTTTTASLQCLFCRTVCTNELEMNFHLAAHARQFRCPICPKAFHVEFLLDRHMQTHHCGTIKDSFNDGSYKTISVNNNNNNNNNTIDYHYAMASGVGKNFYSYSTNSKSFSPRPMATSLYGFYDRMCKSRYGELTGKNLINLYNIDAKSKFYLPEPLIGATTHLASNDIYGATNDVTHKPDFYMMHGLNGKYFSESSVNDVTNTTANPNAPTALMCGICERCDFSNENEVHTHRKIAHNVKTGVSLQCAYCNDNFRSR